MNRKMFDFKLSLDMQFSSKTMFRKSCFKRNLQKFKIYNFSYLFKKQITTNFLIILGINKLQKTTE